MTELLFALGMLAVIAVVVAGVWWLIYATEGPIERELKREIRAHRKYVADSVKAMDEFDRKQTEAAKKAYREAKK